MRLSLRRVKPDKDDQVVWAKRAVFHSCRCLICRIAEWDETMFTLTIGSFSFEANFGTWRAIKIDCTESRHCILSPKEQQRVRKMN